MNVFVVQKELECFSMCKGKPVDVCNVLRSPRGDVGQEETHKANL